jgi:acyl dehydratase
MQALHAATLPSALRAYAGILFRARGGLRALADMPRLERSLSGVSVEPGWLRSYREIIGAADHASDLLPPLALQIAAAPLHLSILADPRFPFRALGIVHVAQSVKATGELRARQPFELRAFTTEATEARRGITFGLVTEALVGGAVIWRGETTALSPKRGPREPRVAKTDVADEPGWERLGALSAGASLGRRYASVASDLNPIHQHALLAKPFGFPRAIVHGTWTLGAALAMAGAPASASHALQAKFLKPVFLPSGLEVFSRTEKQVRHLKVCSKDGLITHLLASVEA